MSLLELKHAFNPKCKACPLHESAGYVCIPGRGNDEADIMILGQAPGEVEDDVGRCFEGPAGQLLQQAVKEYELSGRVYVTNATKCYPPKDRTPKKAELKACKQYLDAEIEWVKPRVIVVLGNTAMEHLVGKSGITKVNGRWVGEYEGARVFAILHPAYILRSPKALPEFEAAWQTLAGEIGLRDKVQAPKETKIEPWQLPSFYKDAESVALDFETSGKYDCDGGWLRSVGFSDGDKCWWMPVETNPIHAMEALRSFIEDDVPKVVHNVVFEGRWLYDLFGEIHSSMRYDTMLMHHLIDENRGHGLKALTQATFQAADWDLAGGVEWEAQGWTRETVPLDRLGPYNAADAYWTHRLYTKLRPQMTDALKKHYQYIMMPLAKLCARMESRGVYIDRKYATKLDAEFEERQTAITTELEKKRPVKTLVKQLTEERKKLNWNSDHQMRTLFFDILKLEPTEFTESKKPSVKESAVAEFDHPIVRKRMEWKELQTLRNNFLQKWPAMADKKGIVRSSFNPAFVVTGRLSVTKPPLQAAPAKHADVRGMVASRFKGGVITAADYAQLELRLMASEAGEQSLIDIFEEDGDPHGDTAQRVFGDGWTKADRLIAKRINFGIAYGVTEYTLMREFNMSEAEATKILYDFKKARPKIFKWMKKQHTFVRVHHYVDSRFGRRRRLEEGLGDKRQQEAVLRQAGNFPIQSDGADLCNLACVLLDRELRVRELKSMLMLQVHDSVIVDTQPKEVDEVRELCVEIMEEKVPAMCSWLRVNLKVDVDQTERWG